MSAPLRIPQPRPRPLVGNVPDVGMETPVQNMMKLAREYGPVFRLKFPTTELMVVSSQQLVNELCDAQRFDKHVHAPLQHIRALAGDGLFTADTSMPNWGRAHRILMPAFGPQAVKNYFDGMYDIAEQLISKWARLGDRVDHDVPDNMTRLTLDTIALCGFGYRFNSFYQPKMHPFVDAMVRSLSEAGARSRRLPLQTKVNLLGRLQFGTDLHFMNSVVDELIRERRSEGATDGHGDLLSLMLAGRDPQTGEGLDDLNIRYQMVTFLIAGHETTSGLLSFALYELMRHPDLLARARAEVDTVLGGDVPRFEHLAKLTFIDQVLRETLRLWPTAPAFAMTPKTRTTFAGAEVNPGDSLLVLVPMLHRDPAVWSGDVERFDPERFAPAKIEAIAPNAWKPFGTGERACIGRPFAMQEATLVLAMLLQRFDLIPSENYQLVVKETLTLKPEGLTMRVRERTNRPRTSPSPAKQVPVAPVSSVAVAQHGKPMLVLFGSNSGSSEAFARRVANDARNRGYSVKLSSMNEASGKLPTSGALVVVTASYNGQPPDNARAFCDWLDTVPPSSLSALHYVVFGCGNRDWAATYQAVPARIDLSLERAGAQRLVSRGAADARADFFGDFEAWYAPACAEIDRHFEVSATTAASGPLYEVKRFEQPTPEFAQSLAFSRATVTENRELVDLRSPLGRSKKHLTLSLPAGVTYRTGDYLSVIAPNPVEVVARAARRFGLQPEALVELGATNHDAAVLPVGVPLSVQTLLSSYVELSQPATRKQVELLVARTRCPPEKARVQGLVDELIYRTQVLEKRVSLLDLLELCPAAELTFAEFLELLPPSKPRLYSISSSPLVDPAVATLTVSVVEGPAWSGQGTYRGVASSWLASRRPGDEVLVATKSPNLPFRLPESPEQPLILVAAGTGLAPFRGFLQERAALGERGHQLGPALLFFGCDHPEVDFLHRDELEAWQASGVVSLHPAFFKQPAGEVSFVQHRLWKDRAEVRAAIDAGATVFVCGDGSKMAPAVREAVGRILAGDDSSQSPAALAAKFEADGRLIADVFS